MWFDQYRLHLITGILLTAAVFATPVAGQQTIPRPIPDSPVAAIEETPVLSPGTLDRLHWPLLRRDLKIQGSASCATANCHAGPRPALLDPTAKRSMEYQIWLENDPHSRSWRTICSEESIAMMQRLSILEDGEVIDQAGFDNCLSCHNSTRRFDEPRFASTASQDTNLFLREGVGCSACHGPSEKWISTHFQTGWTPQLATDDGFVMAGDLYARARMCASCHVGDKDRDMNHDIIAAGHPALRYELATFHAWQPKHWRDAESEDKETYESRLWLAGQVAAADASLSLLETRAKDAQTVSEWPEFAAYNCASCHHDLGLDNAREGLNQRRRATAIYSQWNDAGLRWLIQYRVASGEASIEDDHLMSALNQVRDEMERRPTPDAFAVAKASATARMALAAWLEGSPGMHERSHFRSDRLGKIIADAAGRAETFRSWESAVQFYLAVIAARESWPGGWKGPMLELAEQMQYGLQYPEMIDISRYAKRGRARGPQANRAQITAMGTQLASTLGPVTGNPIVSLEADDPGEIRRRLEAMIEKVNQDWAEMRKIREQTQPATEPAVPDPKPPVRKPKTEEELLQELQQDLNEPPKSDE